MPAVLLSICVPTHDGRADALSRALDSIAAEVAHDERVEVCISDNASRDETAGLVESFRDRVGGRVRYRRHSENRGFTQNLLSAVELAEGRWVWLLGSDDVVAPGALAEVTALVERHPSVAGATLNRNLVDRRSPDIVHHDIPELLPRWPELERELRGEREILAELGQLHDYISTQVLDRALWLEAVAQAGPEGLARGRSYPHLVLITLMVRRLPRWVWCPRELVTQRVGASSVFGDRTAYDAARYEAALLTDRSAVWAELLGPWSSLHRALLRRVWWRHFRPPILLFLKLDPGFGADSDLRLLVVLLRHFWWMPRFWALTLPMLLLPGAWLRALRVLIRAGKRRREL